MVYLAQLTSYSVLAGVSGMPSSNKNNYISVSTRNFDARNWVDVSAPKNSIRNSQKLWFVECSSFGILRTNCGATFRTQTHPVGWVIPCTEWLTTWRLVMVTAWRVTIYGQHGQQGRLATGYQVFLFLILSIRLFVMELDLRRAGIWIPNMQV